MTWDGDDRRSSNKSIVRDQIFKAIQESEDKNLKAILALMYGSLEYTDEAIGRIEAKIDSLRHDETALKKLVLNGYNDKHHDHHSWLDRRIANDGYMKGFVQRAEPLLNWVEQYKLEYEEIKPICAWAKEAMEEHKVAKEDKKTLIMRFIGSVLSQIGTIIATALVTWIMWGPK